MSINEPDRTSNAAPVGSPLRVAEIQNGLCAQQLGTKVHYFSELPSTNTHARQLAEKGALAGEIVIAETQTQGRGRLGRSWASPPYVNLYFSVILRPRLQPIHAPQITLMAAVALADTIDAFIPASAAIKWPNDILADGKKLAGILAESSCTSERIEFVILGIGVNLNFTGESMPKEIRDHATSVLTLTQKSVNREAFMRRLIQDLDRCYGELEESGFGALALRWNERFWLKGRTVRVKMVDQILKGRAEGIDRDGALLLEDEAGLIQRVVAGDVIPVDDP